MLGTSFSIQNRQPLAYTLICLGLLVAGCDSGAKLDQTESSDAGKTHTTAARAFQVP